MGGLALSFDILLSLFLTRAQKLPSLIFVPLHRTLARLPSPNQLPRAEAFVCFDLSPPPLDKPRLPAARPPEPKLLQTSPASSPFSLGSPPLCSQNPRSPSRVRDWNPRLLPSAPNTCFTSPMRLVSPPPASPLSLETHHTHLLPSHSPGRASPARLLPEPKVPRSIPSLPQAEALASSLCLACSLPLSIADLAARPLPPIRLAPSSLHRNIRSLTSLHRRLLIRSLSRSPASTPSTPKPSKLPDLVSPFSRQKPAHLPRPFFFFLVVQAAGFRRPFLYREQTVQSCFLFLAISKQVSLVSPASFVPLALLIDFINRGNYSEMLVISS